MLRKCAPDALPVCLMYRDPPRVLFLNSMFLQQQQGSRKIDWCVTAAPHCVVPQSMDCLLGCVAVAEALLPLHSAAKLAGIHNLQRQLRSLWPRRSADAVTGTASDVFDMLVHHLFFLKQPRITHAAL